MTKILVISDTHQVIAPICKILSQPNHNFDYVLHLGDLTSDLEELQRRFDLPMYGIKGNCDFAMNYNTEKYLTIEGVKILMTHGHRFKVKQDLKQLKSLVELNEIDLALYGHTHIPHVEFCKNYKIMNPGSVQGNRNSNQSSYGIIEIGHGGGFELIVKFI